MQMHDGTADSQPKSNATDVALFLATLELLEQLLGVTRAETRPIVFNCQNGSLS